MLPVRAKCDGATGLWLLLAGEQSPACGILSGHKALLVRTLLLRGGTLFPCPRSEERPTV